MRRVATLVLLLLATALVASACGKASQSQKQEARTEAAKFEVQAKRCLPSPDGALSLAPLRTKSGRVAFAACLVPRAQRKTFASCAEHAVIGKFNRTKIEAGLNGCLEKVS